MVDGTGGLVVVPAHACVWVVAADLGVDWRAEEPVGLACSLDPGAVPQGDRDDDQVVIADLDQDAVVTDAVAPVAGEIPSQALATGAWVVEVAHLVEVGLDAAKRLSIQFACSLRELR